MEDTQILAECSKFADARLSTESELWFAVENVEVALQCCVGCKIKNHTEQLPDGRCIVPLSRSGKVEKEFKQDPEMGYYLEIK
jgi:hypothetical protein